MHHFPRQVPWANTEEWESVFYWLYSSDITERRIGVERVLIHQLQRRSDEISHIHTENQ